MDTVELTVELTAPQRAEAEAVQDILMAKMRVECRRMAELLASKANGELFGETEFVLRGMLLGLGAQAMAATLDHRKKRGTKGPA